MTHLVIALLTYAGFVLDVVIPTRVGHWRRFSRVLTRGDVGGHRQPR